MKKFLFFFLSLFFLSHLQAQWHVGVFGGISNYEGDVTYYKMSVKKVYHLSKPALGLTASYDVSDRVVLRGGLTFAQVMGADKYSEARAQYLDRNLSFQSNITEFSLVGELNIFNLSIIRWSPYLFGGLAIYHFNPYTYDSTNKKVFLHPLSTEGEGLSLYPDRKPYALTEIAIPFGGGIKYKINDKIQIAGEIGLRRLFTDYLDDVSKTYVDPAALLAARGPEAVALSYRGDEVRGQALSTYPDVGYPQKGAQRGSDKKRDWYYFTGFHLTYALGSNGGGHLFSGGSKGKYGCPKVF